MVIFLRGEGDEPKGEWELYRSPPARLVPKNGNMRLLIDAAKFALSDGIMGFKKLDSLNN